MDDKSKAIVVSAVVRLLERWRLSESQKVAVLGFESKADYDKFVDSPVTLNWSQSLEEHLSLVLNIHAELRTLSLTR
ncbi:hypothetical protein RS130_07310 [Paraglaciecola aquimarina]|uniref:Uncharacterized protein n=1 Tax=Paraglaciecola aquimarina TaxID=1235557 RepID=A0ABU3SUQ6_9ALTE|nr:hypothetical protein [Paraglaciecola aquimarina]MDU0353755.1 hypothetical protein [Paraglaciecola aquimarina]